MRVSLRLTLPRDARYVPVLRAATSSVLRELGAPREDAEDVELVISEACGNVVRHATGSEAYSVGVAVDAHGCDIEVVDVGPGFDVEASCPDSDSETGRGLYLMRTLVDRLEFLADDEGTRIVLQKRWGTPPAVAEQAATAAEPGLTADLGAFAPDEPDASRANGEAQSSPTRPRH